MLLRRPWSRVATLMVCAVVAGAAGWLTWTANEGKAAVVRLGEQDFSAAATHLIHGLAAGGVGAFFGWVCWRAMRHAQRDMVRKVGAKWELQTGGTLLLERAGDELHFSSAAEPQKKTVLPVSDIAQVLRGERQTVLMTRLPGTRALTWLPVPPGNEAFLAGVGTDR